MVHGTVGVAPDDIEGLAGVDVLPRIAVLHKDGGNFAAAFRRMVLLHVQPVLEHVLRPIEEKALAAVLHEIKRACIHLRARFLFSVNRFSS